MRTAVRALTDEIADRLREVTLNLSARDDLEMIVAADRIYSRERKLHAPRERDPLAKRVPRLRRGAHALEWLRTHEPDTYRALARRVRRVDAVSRAIGVEEGAVPRRYPAGSVAWYVLREGFALVLGLPLAVVGSVIWYPAWAVPRWVIPA